MTFREGDSERKADFSPCHSEQEARRRTAGATLLCSAAPTGDNVFLALFSDQVGNYEHINALQSNTCQDNRWPITPSNLDLWSPAPSIKHRISPLGKTLSSVQHSMFKYHGRFNTTRSPCSKYGHSIFPRVNWSTGMLHKFPEVFNCFHVNTGQKMEHC